MTTVRVSDDADRATLVTAIQNLRRKQQRMPAHWEARRLEVARDIDALVDRIVAMDRAAV